MKFNQLAEQYKGVILSEKKFKVNPGSELKRFKEERQRSITAAEEAQDKAYAFDQMLKELPHADALAEEVANWLQEKGFNVDLVEYRSISPEASLWDKTSDSAHVAYEFNFTSAGDAKVDKEFDMEYDAFLLSKGYTEGYRGKKQRVVIIPVDVS